MRKALWMLGLGLGLAIMGTSVTLTGCSGIIRDDAFEKDISEIPPYATNNTNELYEDTFYIWEDEENGTLLADINADQLKFKDYKKKLFTPAFNIVLQNSDLDIGDSLRIIWMNDSIEDSIPTFFKGSELVYYSSTSFPENVKIERFYDHGYSVGLYGLAEYGKDHYVMRLENTCGATSDAAGLSNLLIDEDTVISIPYIGETALTSRYISNAGTIKGLQKDSQYTLTAYVGSKRYEAPVTANVRIFSSMESFVIPDYEFVGNGLVKYEFPDYMKTGYYYIQGYGIFRYIAEESEVKTFDAEKYKDTDFNSPIILKTANGNVIYDPTEQKTTELTFNNLDALNDSMFATTDFYTATVNYDGIAYEEAYTLKKVIIDFTFKNSVEVNPPAPQMIYFRIDDESLILEDPDNPEEGTLYNPYIYELSDSEIAEGKVHLEWNANGSVDIEAGTYAFVFTNVGSYREHEESIKVLSTKQYIAYLQGGEIEEDSDGEEIEEYTTVVNKTEYENYQNWLKEYNKNMGYETETKAEVETKAEIVTSVPEASSTTESIPNGE